MVMKLPGMTRTVESFAATESSRFFTPAAASSFFAMNSSTAAIDVGVRTTSPS
jgi:hypothetical protein